MRIRTRLNVKPPLPRIRWWGGDPHLVPFLQLDARLFPIGKLIDDALVEGEGFAEERRLCLLPEIEKSLVSRHRVASLRARRQL